jgi:hypothetical protein
MYQAPALILKLWLAFLLPDAPFEFHGQVADPGGKPLEGVNIRAQVFYRRPRPFWGDGDPLGDVRCHDVLIKTDASGNFTIRSRGHLLQIGGFIKRGYKHPGPSSETRQYRFEFYGPLRVIGADAPVKYTLPVADDPDEKKTRKG